jgi:hypothetical protein
MDTGSSTSGSAGKGSHPSPISLPLSVISVSDTTHMFHTVIVYTHLDVHLVDLHNLSSTSHLMGYNRVGYSTLPMLTNDFVLILFVFYFKISLYT